MIALCQNVRQPDGANPAPTQSLMQSVTLQVLVNETRKAQPQHDFEQKWKVINPFCSYVDLRVHPLRLSGNSRFHQNFQRKVSDHAELQRHLRTPICLDESITS